MAKALPTPDAKSGLRALRAMLKAGHPLAALQSFHADLGDVFRINLPGFTPVVLVGPEAARFVLVQGRYNLRWRNERDPVTDLLGHGVLVEDGAEHDRLRRLLNPPLHRRMLADYVVQMWNSAAQITSSWAHGAPVDMLVEMRKVALLSLTSTLFNVDFRTEMARLWDAILADIAYISPGLWMIWQGAPRWGYHRQIQRLDGYLHRIIAARRAAPNVEGATDMLGLLIASGMDDHLIRDQLLTMLIAGHDTVTALMAWALYLLGAHPRALQRATEEARAGLKPHESPSIEQVNSLEYLGWVIREALRLYPPIHLGSRLAAVDLEYQGYHIPAGERVIYSIYLTQRHPAYWPDPDRFLPERHAPGQKQTPYMWLAFGGGPRNCIGAAFGQLEAQVTLAYLFRHFDLQLRNGHVRPHMGATLEPHPGVMMSVARL